MPNGTTMQRRQQAHPRSTAAWQARHRAAVARTLSWADEAAARRDFEDALAWLRTLEAIGEHLPDEYLRKRLVWIQADATGPR